MKVRRAIYTILLAAVMTANSLPNDLAELKFIGFSKDGKYLAFEESGGDSESALYDYTEVYFIETAKNSFAAAPSILQFDESTPAKSKPFLEKRNKQDAAAKLKRFGIVRGNVGQLVAAHLLSDWSNTKPFEVQENVTATDGTEAKKLITKYGIASLPDRGISSEKVIFNSELNDFALNGAEFYELKLDVEPFKNAAGYIVNYGINLTLKNNMTPQEIPIKILQKDSGNLPKARQNAYAYKIEYVYLYGDKIAVFLNVFLPGFESQVMRYMVVTGKI